MSRPPFPQPTQSNPGDAFDDSHIHGGSLGGVTLCAYKLIFNVIQRKNLPNETLSIILNNLGWTYVKLGDFCTGVGLLRDSLSTKKVAGDNAASCSLTMCNLASAYVKQNETEVARSTLKDAERLLKSAYQSSYPNHPALARVYNQLGKLAYDDLNYHIAAEFFAKSVAILDDQFSDCSQQKLISLHNQALANFHSGNRRIAAQLQSRVRFILQIYKNVPVSVAEDIEADYLSFSSLH